MVYFFYKGPFTVERVVRDFRNSVFFRNHPHFACVHTTAEEKNMASVYTRMMWNVFIRTVIYRLRLCKWVSLRIAACKVLRELPSPIALKILAESGIKPTAQEVKCDVLPGFPLLKPLAGGSTHHV